MQNYNLEQSTAILVVVADIDRMFDVFGERAARIYNAAAGLVAQYVYMAASVLDTGCGALLGFDNLALNQMLGLEGSGQSSLLMLLVGNQRKPGSFDYRIA